MARNGDKRHRHRDLWVPLVAGLLTVIAGSLAGAAVTPRFWSLVLIVVCLLTFAFATQGIGVGVDVLAVERVDDPLTTSVLGLHRVVDLRVTLSTAVSVSAAVFLLGLDLGLVTMAVGALTGKKGTAIGVGAAIAAASYLVSSLAPVVSWLPPARYLSVFYWAVGNGQVTGGVSAGDYAVLSVVGLCALFRGNPRVPPPGPALSHLDMH